MCFFFIQSCEPLGKKKKKKKKQKKTTKKIHKWKKCTSFLQQPCVPPASPSSPLSTLLLDWQKPDSGQLACVGNPNEHCFRSRLLGLGKGLSPASCHPWNPFGIQRWPVLLARGGRASQPSCAAAVPTASTVLLLALRPAAANSLPTSLQLQQRSPRAGLLTFCFSNCKSAQSAAASLDPFSPSPRDTCRLATVAFCDAALFGRSWWRRLWPLVCYLHALSLSLTWARAAFPRPGKVHRSLGGFPREQTFR